jgi:hypothetical protein
MNGTEPIVERVPQQGFIGDALRYLGSTMGEGGPSRLKPLFGGIEIWRTR